MEMERFEFYSIPGTKLLKFWILRSFLLGTIQLQTSIENLQVVEDGIFNCLRDYHTNRYIIEKLYPSLKEKEETL